MPVERLSRYIDPVVLAGISRLDLRAKRVVEGFVTGLHRSPFHGYSVEFAEHRAYTPGDDLKHIDWKLFGRADRYYVKRYEEETNLRALLLVDCSRSMAFRSKASPMSKYDYACTVAASLAYLLLLQQDAVGLVLFDERERAELPPSASPAHLSQLCRLMERQPLADKTRVVPLFHRLAEKARRKGLVVVLSDLFAPPEDVARGLEHFRHNRHEVLVFHILDPQELTLDVEGQVRFLGMEGEAPVTADPRRIRRAYREAMSAFCRGMEQALLQREIEYVRMDVSQPIETALGRFLHLRSA